MKEIFERRSIRRYTDQEIPSGHLVLLLRAAMCAPSAGNERPWHFIIIDERDLLHKLPSDRPYFKPLFSAKCAIMVCGDVTARAFDADYWIQDCAACTQNILIEAQHLGLGSVWLGVYPTNRTIREYQELLCLPDHIIPFSIVALGYPVEQKSTPDRYDNTKVHVNSWQ